MPKHGIHYLVLQKMQAKLEDSSEAGDRDLGQILRDNPFAASLGCIGPDLLFWAPDYAVVQQLRDLVENYDRIRRTWETLDEVIEAILDNVEEGVEAVITALEQIPVVGPAIAVAVDYAEAFDAIASEFDKLVAAFKDELKQALFIRILGLDGTAEGVTLARSLFHGLFQCSQQAGREEMDWYWFEMLHYRNTGDFVKALIRNAEASGDIQQMAYAYAYVTHYATDFVGHPFVNTISGSPFRMNVQRHVVIENFMDQWSWGREFNGGNIRNELFSAMGFSLHDDLPQGIATLLVETIKEVYGKVAHPLRYVSETKPLAESVGVRSDRDGFLTERDMRSAFIFLKLMLEFLGGQEEVIRPTEPFPGADAALADLVAGGGMNLPTSPPIPSQLPANAQDLMASIDAWLAEVVTYVEQLLGAALQAFDAAIAALSDFLENPVDELLRQIQLYAYAVQLVFYNIYRQIHQVLALAGLAYPEPDDVALTNPVAEALITTRHVDYKQFPVLRTPGQPHLDTRSYVPSMNRQNNSDFTYQDFESPATIASHYRGEQNGDTPDGFIDGVPLDVELLGAYASAETPNATIRLQEENRRSFGNAVDLSVWILRERNSNSGTSKIAFCNWNLDADRGYGYKSWDGIPFTVWRGEMDGAIDGNESLDEVIRQDYRVWTAAAEVGNAPQTTTEYTGEIYVDAKRPGSSLLAPLNISSYYIPAMFTEPARMLAVPSRLWRTLVPQRFTRSDGTLFQNIFFCNGATTSPSSGIRCTMALQKTLNAAFRGTEQPRFVLKHLHNYSSPEWGDLYLLGDLLEAIPGDYLKSMDNSAAIEAGATLRDATNATQVATVALLHHGLDNDIPLILSGHSQGTMITANAVMIFSTLGSTHRTYLRNRVRLLHMEPELIVGTRRVLRGLVKDYLVYIMNDSDPQGTDLLVEATSGPFPLIPGQPGGLLTNGEGTEAVADLLATPNPLDITFYRNLQAVVDSSNADLTALIRYLMNTGMTAHYMPVQLLIMASDITADRFRTDPGTLVNPTVQLSTPTTLNNTSVRVRQFFTAT
jgi:hypothetical protein